MAPRNIPKPTREKPKDLKKIRVGKKAQKDIAVEKRKNLKKKRDELNEELEKKKEELGKLKEDTPEYEKLKAEVDAQGDTIMEFDNQVQALNEDADMNLDDDDEKEEEEEEAEKENGIIEELFVTADASGSSQLNPIDIASSDRGTRTASVISADSGGKGMAASPMVINDDEEETDVLTREIYNKETGQDIDGKVISWRKVGWGKQALVQYGPRNAALYKLLPTSSAPDFDDTAIPCMTSHRPGEEKDPVTKKWKRTQKDVAALQGVAVHFNSDLPKHHGLTWLDLLNPERHNDEKLRYTNAVCKVKWADGTKPSFETRTTIRRLWSKSKGAGDQALYMVGKENQRRYDEWKSGQLAGEDKSPTPNPAIVNLKREDAESREGSALSGIDSQRSTPPSSVGDTPAPPATSSKPVLPPASSTSAPPKKVKRTEEQFQESWLKRHQLSGDDLEPGQEATMMLAYDAYVAS